MEKESPRIVLQHRSAAQHLNDLLGSTTTVNETQQEIQLPNGCYSAAASDLCNGVSELTVAKKKTRRKPRYKKAQKKANQLVEDDDGSDSSLLSLHFDFKITAIPAQTAGKVYRIKNGLCCRHINLKYVKDVQERCYNKSQKKNSSHKSQVGGRYDSPCKDDAKFLSKIENGSAQRSSSQSEPDVSCLQSPAVGTSAASQKKQRVKVKKKKFVTYLSADVVQEGLACGAFVKGVLRINSKNYREAYVNNVDRTQQDYFLGSVADRNGALDGDIVAIKIKDESEWPEKHKAAFVVHILEEVHPRTAIGFLHLTPDRSKQYGEFIPRDLRVPKIRIPAQFCPRGFHQHPNRYENMLFKARITAWREVGSPIGVIVENVGVNGDLESEMYALLSEHSLDITPFPPSLLHYIPYSRSIPEKEFSYREDLRQQCIFTIDPATARDLDDAVSCRKLANGNVEVGVHISDVAYYLSESTPLDKMVCQKATTIYLVNNVFHMLPEQMCLYCSLLPGLDKLAFSVFWEMTPRGEIISHRFTRSVINSCAQLSYEHAQEMIEEPEREIAGGSAITIHGNYTYKDLSRVVNDLQIIATNLRTKRFDNGALRINQTKLLFRLDESTGEPIEYFVYENKEAHRLIEEFMLLANITVAQRIVEDFPELAFLRCHEPPNQRMLGELEKNLKAFNVDVDVSSSKNIQSSISRVQAEQGSHSPAVAALYHLLAKPMTRARYFCSAEADSDEKFEHYALHVPIYTHFTSPIRRYADIMVHRLLSAGLGYTPKPNWAVEDVMIIANNCNKQKYSAKLAGEASSDLYLTHYVADHQPFIQQAVVVDVKNSSFDVLVNATGSIVRIFSNAFDSSIQCTQVQEDSHRQFVIVFPKTAELPEEEYLIQMFSIVTVSLHRKPKTNKLEAKLLRPGSGQPCGEQITK